MSFWNALPWETGILSAVLQNYTHRLKSLRSELLEISDMYKQIRSSSPEKLIDLKRFHRYGTGE